MFNKRSISAAIFVFLFSIIFQTNAFSQFYYNDFVNVKRANEAYALLLKSGIKEVTAKSFEANGLPVADFFYTREILKNGTLVTTSATYTSADKSYTEALYENSRLVHTYDSTGKVVSIIDYTYTDSGNIASIKNKTNDAEMESSSEEVHQWFYDEQNVPDYMLRVKNGNDTMEIEFEIDDKGNIVEEFWQKKGKTMEHYYYYYNDDGLLTDVVRYNKKAAQLLPEFILEYNDKQQVAVMTQISAGAGNYTIWKYVYDDRGLKVKDVLFNKDKRPLGKIDYQYK